MLETCVQTGREFKAITYMVPIFAQENITEDKTRARSSEEAPVLLMLLVGWNQLPVCLYPRVLSAQER